MIYNFNDIFRFLFQTYKINFFETFIFAAKVKQIKGMEGQEEGQDFDDKCGACGRDTTGMKVSKYKYKYRSF